VLWASILILGFVCLAALVLVRALAEDVELGDTRQLRRPWVIDGDTIDDKATLERYRLANIDAPETGDNAKCFNERRVGERAKAAAIRLVRNASVVSVQSIQRRDQYGRILAYVLVDGADLGEALANMGLARWWHGQRKPWCGPDGPLAKMAALRGERLSCSACAKWRRR
jgi:endonuclease YncB( thermonuclease family)